MKWLELCFSFIEHLAWPAVVLVAVILFRQQIRALIADADEVETPIITIRRGDRPVRDLQASVAAARQEIPVSTPPDAGTATHDEELFHEHRAALDSDIVQLKGKAENPYAAVMEASDLVTAIVALACAVVDLPGYEGHVWSIDDGPATMLQAVAAPKSLVDSVRQSWQLRQDVIAFRVKFTPDAARAYVDSAGEAAKATIDWALQKQQSAA